MKLHQLHNVIDQFLEQELRRDDTDWYFPHSIVLQFHDTWNDPLIDRLKDRYDKALKSEISQRWWKGDQYRPKDIMLTLIETDEELASIAFKDLANDTATLDGRLSRFTFYAEELVTMYRRNNPRDIESHHHQDAAIISLYLSGMFPDKYTLYAGLREFQSYCKVVGSPEIPVIDDLPRYMKVAAIVFKFLQQHKNYAALVKNRNSSNHKVKWLPYQTCYEIFLFAHQHSDKLTR